MLDSQKRISDGEAVRSLADSLDGAEGRIVSVAKQSRKSPPPLPYSLPKLQMAASKRYDMTDTLAHAQKLYEAGCISYPRTECENVPEWHFKDAPKILDAIREGFIELLESGKGSSLTRPDMTALWERAMDGIEAGESETSLESFVAEVAGMVREIVSAPLDVPSEIPGMERRQSGEIVEAPCPLNCGGKARRYEGKYGPFWRCGCSAGVTFADSMGSPVVKEPRAEAPCPVPGCKGRTTKFTGKKDGRPFWKCCKCGQFFDDIGGTPMAREMKSKRRKEHK